jgi:hypothetical protein
MDCNRCASCCRAFGIIEISGGDTVPEEFTVPTCLGYSRMRTDGFNCCCLGWKDGQESCSIYENRPWVCQHFVPGSELCTLARSRFNLMPL